MAQCQPAGCLSFSGIIFCPAYPCIDACPKTPARSTVAVLRTRTSWRTLRPALCCLSDSPSLLPYIPSMYAVMFRRLTVSAATSHKHPTLHPAFGHYPEQTTPSIHFDMTKPPDFSVLLSSAYVPLYSEELDTFLTHPPIRYLHLVLCGYPELSYTLDIASPGGITLRLLVHALVEWCSRHIHTDEWNTIGKLSRERIRGAHQRRVGASRISARLSAGETPYLVRDALGERTMFLAIERQRGRRDAGKDVYLLHTTIRARCKVWR
jgi:hypothetical protein